MLSSDFCGTHTHTQHLNMEAKYLYTVNNINKFENENKHKLFKSSFCSKRIMNYVRPTETWEIKNIWYNLKIKQFIYK